MEGIGEISSAFRIEDAYMEGRYESEGLEYHWAADIEAHPEGSEVTMIYRFPQESYEGLKRYISEENLPYREPFTGKKLFPSVDLDEDAKVVVWVPPAERPAEHEFAYFPADYLDELREDFFQQLRPFLDG